MALSDLSEYVTPDTEKRAAIDNILFPPQRFEKYGMRYSFQECDYADMELSCADLPPTRYCPQCFRQYPEEENFCYECLCSLKRISDMKSPAEVKANPSFTFDGSNDFEGFAEIFSEENITKITEFAFCVTDLKAITEGIKRTALKNMDAMVRENEIIIDRLSVRDRVLLFSKAFVDVDYKSYGAELGHFEFNRITVDDRQPDSLQMTTLIHELAHFLMKEIIVRIICKILDCAKNPLIESVATYILVCSPFTRLIDEYSAHTVEGRFTLYGYQDYSSFLGIEQSLRGEMGSDEIEMTKTIGNAFSIYIKDILESFLDDDLRSEIKDQFLMETRDSPNYEMLLLENCSSLTDAGFVKAMALVVVEGFYASSLDVEKLAEYAECF